MNGAGADADDDKCRAQILFESWFLRSGARKHGLDAEPHMASHAWRVMLPPRAASRTTKWCRAYWERRDAIKTIAGVAPHRPIVIVRRTHDGDELSLSDLIKQIAGTTGETRGRLIGAKVVGALERAGWRFHIKKVGTGQFDRVVALDSLPALVVSMGTILMDEPEHDLVTTYWSSPSRLATTDPWPRECERPPSGPRTSPLIATTSSVLSAAAVPLPQIMPYEGEPSHEPVIGHATLRARHERPHATILWTPLTDAAQYASGTIVPNARLVSAVAPRLLSEHSAVDAHLPGSRPDDPICLLDDSALDGEATSVGKAGAPALGSESPSTMHPLIDGVAEASREDGRGSQQGHKRRSPATTTRKISAGQNNGACNDRDQHDDDETEDEESIDMRTTKKVVVDAVPAPPARPDDSARRPRYAKRRRRRAPTTADMATTNAFALILPKQMTPTLSTSLTSG
jgi:hypothetical protein